jgi:hypothetical protein
MRAGHSENVCRAIDEGGGERLAAEAANVDAFLFAHVDCVEAWRLPTNGMDPGGRDFDVFAVAEQTTKKAFCHRAAADISCADEEDAFHDFEPAPCRQGKIRPNEIKSTNGGRVDVALGQIKEEREAEGNADKQSGDYRQPKKRHRRTPAFREDENEEDDGGDDNVESEERADASGEQFVTEQRNVQAMFHYPRREFPIRKQSSYDAESEISVTQSHCAVN